MFKKNDFILIGVVLLIGISAIFLINMTKTTGNKVLLIVKDKTVKTFPLNKDTTFTYRGDDGISNSFQIKNGYVVMLDADCPDKLCVKHKKIHYNHETIVCLPHKLVIEVVGGDTNDVDMIAN